MSKSTDDTNELESYGVWVKHPTDATEESSIESLNSDETDELDLPDFEDSDFSDMFKDDSEFSSETENNNFIDDDNSTLSVDELANITSSAETVEEDFVFEESSVDDIDIVQQEMASDENALTEEDFSFEDVEETAADDFDIAEFAAETEEVTEDTNIEETTADDFDIADFAADTEEVSASEDINLEETTADDFDIADFAADTEEAAVSEDVNLEETTADDFDIADFAADTEEVTVSEDVNLEETTADDFDIADFAADTEEAAVSEETEEFTFEDITNNNESTESAEEEISLDDFGMDFSDSGDATVEETAVSEASGEEEISLDDFMEEGFSDDSVAAGNNGYAPDAIPTSASEEISLDDFGFTDTEETSTQEVIEDTVDEAPLEMDLNFDDSVDSIETEENISVEEDFEYDSEDSETEETTETPAVEEEVSLDSFTSDSSSFESESVDLSDFGIDSDAEETPVTQDVSSAKLVETKIDYDLSVGNANTAAPVVTEIQSNVDDNVEQIEEIDSEDAEPAPAAANDSASISASLLQQIVNDLSGLKNEISQLKNNLEEMKTTGIVSSDTPVTEPEEKEESGFFSSDDGDDTIALSFDELDNIMNNAEFNTEETTVTETDNISTEEPVIDDNLFVEPETEETAVDLPSDDLPESMDFNFENTAVQESFTTSDETLELDTEDLPSEITIPKYDDPAEPEMEEPVIETETSVEENDEPVDSIFVGAVTDEEPNFDIGVELSNDTVEEEPVFEETETTTVEESDEPVIEESDEPVIEDIFVESDENTEEPVVEEETSISEAEDSVDSIFVGSDSDEEPNFDIGEELSNDTVEEEPVFEETETTTVEDTVSDEPVIEDTFAEATTEEETFESVDSILNDTETTEENETFSSVDDVFDSIETTENEEPEIVETSVEPVAEETEEFDPFTPASEDVTESDINFLTADNAAVESKTPNDELKQDIKSVLLYMDQLLENLPEEKIIEFAKSDEFSTYKKLFSELGLS